MNAYTIGCTTVLMATGTLADRYGRRRVFLLSVLAFGLASLWCGWASSTPVLIAGRLVQGIAGGAMFICSIAILSHQFPDGPGARAPPSPSGAWWPASGWVFGPMAGSAIVWAASWHWAFLVQCRCPAPRWLDPVGMSESRAPQAREHRLDWAGLVTLTLAVLGFTGFSCRAKAWAGRAPPRSAWRPGRCQPGGLHRGGAKPAPPDVDFSLFAVRNFSGAILACVGMNCSYWPFMIYLPFYFSTGAWAWTPPPPA